LSADAEKLLQRLLPAVGQLQKIPEGQDTPVQIDAGQIGKIVGQIIAGTFLLDKRQVKVIAIEMNEVGKPGGKLKKGGHNLPLVFRRDGKPLDQFPLPLLTEGTANQIDHGTFGGEASGLDVQKQCFGQGKLIFQRIGWVDACQFFPDCAHGASWVYESERSVWFVQ